MRHFELTAQCVLTSDIFQVRVDCSVLHAIECNYIDLVELILKHHMCLNAAVSDVAENVYTILQVSKNLKICAAYSQVLWWY